MEKHKSKYSFLFKHIVVAVVLVNGYFISFKQEYSLINLSNATFLIGMLYLIIGLFRVTRYLHLYDSLFYGLKKFYVVMQNRFKQDDKKQQEDRDYKDNYNKPVIELIVIGLMLTCISAFCVAII